MEAAVVGDRAQQASRQAHQEVRVELLEMARSIAQTRAAVAESRPAPSQHLAAESAGESAPDVAAAAERLRQIAWTMRACGVDLPASDQIGQIADTILSADALRDLGDQRAHKLTEALHYLEHRIDRMLDGHLAAAAAVAADDAVAPLADDPVATANGANDNDHHADAVVLTLTAPLADVATTLETEARTESPPAAEDDSAPAAFVAVTDAAEFPMDDDVVLTVTDSAVEPEPIPTTNFAPEALPDERAGLDAAPVAPVQVAAAAEVEDDSDTEAEFGALAFERLVVMPAVAALPGGLPSVAAQEPAQETAREIADAPRSTVASADHVVAGESAAALPQASAEELNAIAMQVEHDLDELADAAPVVSTDDAAHARKEEPAAANGRATVREDDPADFLLETPVEILPDHAPMAALVASAQATRAQLSTALAAIETELSAAATPLPVRTDTATAPRSAHADGPLAALMLLSEEERLALFS
jgi:hypothetical protein